MIYKAFLVLFLLFPLLAEEEKEAGKYIAPFFTEEKRNLIQAYVTDQITSTGLVGASYVLVEGEEIKEKKSFNLLGYPYLEDRSLPLGNFSRMLTILAAYKLRDESKINFEHKVLDYLPSLKIGVYDKESYFLVKHLLLSSTGLNLGHDRIIHRQDGTIYRKAGDLLGKLKDLDYNRAPGVLYEESHLNTMILSQLISASIGKGFTEFMEEDIFRPLDFGFYYEPKKFRREGTPIYHYFFSSRTKTNPEESPDVFLASNRVYGKIEDIGRFISLQLGALDKDLFPVLTLREIRNTTLPAKGDETLRYGGAWYSGEIASRKVFYANFTGKGSCGSIYLYPELNAGFGIFFPIEGAPACHNLAKGISMITFGIPPANIGVASAKTMTLFSFLVLIVSMMLLFVISFKTDRFFSMLPRPIIEKKDAAKNFVISMFCFLILFWFCFLFFPNSEMGLGFTSLPYSKAMYGWIPDLFYALMFMLFVLFLFVVYFAFEMIRAGTENL
jgi:hypothetical protein